jgi:hypothetical protein
MLIAGIVVQYQGLPLRRREWIGHRPVKPQSSFHHIVLLQ